MPISIPPFVQYQAPMFPLRALWNSAPPEGDMFISCEVDWGQTTPPGSPAVQCALSGNSPLSFSQIVALAVDNARCGADVNFVFTDSGFVLVVPGFNQGIYPVFTNALMFYVTCPNASGSDITSFQILNSMPPPVAIQPSQEQSHASVAGVPLANNASNNIIPPPTAGTLQSLSITANITTGAAPAEQAANLELVDGAGNLLWETGYTFPADTVTTVPINLTGLRLSFVNGVNLVVSNSTMTSGFVVGSVYYSVP